VLALKKLLVEKRTFILSGTYKIRKIETMSLNPKTLEKIKNNAKAAMQRQIDTGITQYTWLTSKDQRTCKACARNNGKVFSWDSPPETGHPGEGNCCPDTHCRCQAIAVIKL